MHKRQKQVAKGKWRTAIIFPLELIRLCHEKLILSGEKNIKTRSQIIRTVMERWLKDEQKK